MFHSEFINWLMDLDAFKDVTKISEVRAVSPDPQNTADVAVTLNIPLGIPDNSSFGKTAVQEDLVLSVVLSGYSLDAVRVKSMALKDNFNRFRGKLVENGTVTVQSSSMQTHSWTNNDESEPLFSYMAFAVRLQV